jgi:hypothetical protein
LRDEPRKFRSYQILDLISKSQLPLTHRLLLHLIVRYTNRKSGIAWASQKRLAADMGAGESSVKRWFTELRAAGAIDVRRIRSGKAKTKQYNEYWIVPEKLPGLKLEHSSQASPAHGAEQGSFRTRAGLATDKNRGLSTAHSYEPGCLDLEACVDRASEVSLSGGEPRNARTSAIALPPLTPPHTRGGNGNFKTVKPETKTSDPTIENEQRRKIQARDTRLSREAAGQYRESRLQPEQQTEQQRIAQQIHDTFAILRTSLGDGERLHWEKYLLNLSKNCNVTFPNAEVKCDNCNPLPKAKHHRSWCRIMPDIEILYWAKFKFQNRKYRAEKRRIERKFAHTPQW